ncbi:MAG: transcriptional repressor, partial [Nevskiales bacterium]
HHDHMVDIETGKVVEFVSEEIEQLQRQIADKHGYEIADHSLVLYVKPKKK